MLIVSIFSTVSYEITQKNYVADMQCILSLYKNIIAGLQGVQSGKYSAYS